MTLYFSNPYEENQLFLSEVNELGGVIQKIENSQITHKIHEVNEIAHECLLLSFVSKDLEETQMHLEDYLECKSKINKKIIDITNEHEELLEKYFDASCDINSFFFIEDMSKGNELFLKIKYSEIIDWIDEETAILILQNILDVMEDNTIDEFLKVYREEKNNIYSINEFLWYWE